MLLLVTSEAGQTMAAPSRFISRVFPPPAGCGGMMKNHAKREAAMMIRPVCYRCRHPRSLHHNGTSGCTAPSCHAGPGQGPCPSFEPADARAPEPVPAAVAGPLPPLMVDVRGAARLLRLGRCSVLKLADEGQLTRLYYGRSLRFAVGDLETWSSGAGWQRARQAITGRRGSRPGGQAGPAGAWSAPGRACHARDALPCRGRPGYPAGGTGAPPRRAASLRAFHSAQPSR